MKNENNMKYELLSVDGKNGMTYIGKDITGICQVCVGMSTLENYVVIPTAQLSSDKERNYVEKARDSYKNLKKVNNKITILRHAHQTWHYLKIYF